MTSSATSNLRLEKQGVTDNPGTWGDRLNVALDMVDAAICGVADVSTTGGETTLSDSDYTSDDAKAFRIDVTGTLASNATIVVPSRNKVYAVRNNTSGAYSVTIKTSGGTGVAIPQGASQIVVVDASEDEVTTLTTAGSLDIAGDSGTGSVNVDTQALSITTSQDSLVTAASGQAVAITLADVLEDLDTLGPSTADGEFLVATGAGALAWESGATARTSMDVYSTSETDAAIAAAVTAEDLDFAGDSGTGSVDLDSQSLTIATTQDSLVTAASGQTLTITLADVLEDLDTLGPAASDGQFLVATGPGALAWESGNTARTSLGVGTGDSPTLTAVTLSSGTGLQVGSSVPFSDAAGTLTLQNVDALDATTEATIEAAIDTLANLGSIQGQAFTFGAYAPTLLNTANEAGFKAAVNLEIGTDVQAYSANLTTWAGLAPSANAQSLVTAADYAAMRALLDLEPGTDFYSISAANAAFQPLDAVLTDLAGIALVQGDILYHNGTNLVRLGPGTSGHFLQTQGAAANPAWAAVPGGGDLLSTNNLSDVANAATAFGNIKQAASDSATGVVELATTAEVQTGTDTARAVTPAGVAAFVLDEDDFASDSAARPPSQQSVKAYVDGLLTDVAATVYSSGSGTYTVPSGTRALIVRLCGGGGGCGGANSATGIYSGGGGAGAFAEIFIPNSALEASYTYAVGAGGAGGSSSGGNGSSGGDTTWAGAASFLVTAGGGGGGAGGTTPAFKAGGAAGVASSASLPAGVVVASANGNKGGDGNLNANIPTNNGGGSSYGPGPNGSGNTGSAGTFPGTGAGGFQFASSLTATGAAGAAGRIEVIALF